MIISHKYKFIFIKTKKTAGTSIEIFLSQCCGPNDVVTPINPHIEPHAARNYKGFWNPWHDIITQRRTDGFTNPKIIRQTFRKLRKQKKFYNHIPARILKNRISNRVWNNYYKFCVERNPWDKTLSDYHMRRDRAGGDLSLDQYFRNGKFCLNSPLYTDIKGNLAIDRVIKYETLNAEFDQIFNMLGIPFNGSLNTRAKSDHRRDRMPYTQVFTTKHINWIETIFADEIKMHGYTY
jgi:hypothetical protein